MTLFEVFDWLEMTTIGRIIRESLWLFPAIEAVHLLGLAVIGGSILVVDMRLLGAGITRLSTSQVLANARPWFLGALATMLATGIPLFLSEAIKCYYNTSFWVKMVALVVGIAFTFGVRNRVASRDDAPAWLAKMVGAASLAVWFTVAAAGRWIGFS